MFGDLRDKDAHAGHMCIDFKIVQLRERPRSSARHAPYLQIAGEEIMAMALQSANANLDRGESMARIVA